MHDIVTMTCSLNSESTASEVHSKTIAEHRRDSQGAGGVSSSPSWQGPQSLGCLDTKEEISPA